MIYNKLCELQVAGVVPQTDNVLEQDYIKRLYQSDSISTSNPGTFLTLILFHVAVVTACHPKSLATMNDTKFNINMENWKEVIGFTSVMRFKDL